MELLKCYWESLSVTEMGVALCEAMRRPTKQHVEKKKLKSSEEEMLSAQVRVAMNV